MRLIKKEDGQASVVGTIMALMVVIAFLTMFTDQYLPAAMNDMESEHVFEVLDQFSTLKQSVDNQILMNNTDVILYSPIRLGSSNIPSFTSPTGGFLEFKPANGSMNIQFDINAAGGTIDTINESSSGSLEFFTPNRYYIPSRMVYESTGILKHQYGGSIMEAPPHVLFTNVSGNNTLSVTLVTLVGEASSMSGFETVGVQTRLAFLESFTYDSIASPVNITMNTDFNTSWEQFFEVQFQEQGINATTYPFDTSTNEVGYSIPDVTRVRLTIAVMDISLGSSTINIS